jgi:hypothetical protein
VSATMGAASTAATVVTTSATTADGASAMEAIASSVAACRTAAGIVTGIAVPIPTRVPPGVGVTIVPTRVPSGVAAPITPDVASSIATADVTIAAVTPVSVMTPVIPRASTDEYSAHKPLRTVETIGCAGIRIIGIVPIRTYGRRRIHISRVRIALIVTLIGITGVVPDANSCFDLRLRVSERQRQDCQ